ncbi:MAG: ATP-binding cassette domain-containing protein [Alphaproteobacteria bacterium]|nr:MAG: ATP-binding cassette domain-containing protein [Alphaproteobacteria bacterium]
MTPDAPVQDAERAETPGLVLDGVGLRRDGFRLSADFAVPPRARVAVIGPSGAGKSTLLAAIAGFLPLERGRVLIAGRDVTALRPAERPVTMLFQDHNLFPHLSAFDNVALGLSPRLRLSPAERRQVQEVLERVGLGDLAGRKPGQLSGGQISRVALARALIRRRPLLLLDEPFAALGPALKAEMLDLVGEIARETGATLLMVTHDPEDARRLCELTVVVDEGQAAPPRPTAALLAAPPPGLARYLGTAAGARAAGQG